MKILRARFLQYLAGLPLMSCRTWLPEAVRPVRRLVMEPLQGPATEVVILLPGRRSVPEEFVREGIVSLIQEKRPSARVVAPDLHLRYYMERSATDCLWEEIIQPARKEGLEVTLLGVSLGGLGALITLLEHPLEIRQVMLLAPYLGEEKLIQEIRAAGGLEHFSSGVTEPDDQDAAMRLLWGRLRTLRKKRLPVPLPITLACGHRDRHLAANRLFAEELLKPSQYQEVEGGHDWSAWRKGSAWLLR